jgi:hypothetical protein
MERGHFEHDQVVAFFRPIGSIARRQAKSAMFDAALRQLLRPEYNVQVDR